MVRDEQLSYRPVETWRADEVRSELNNSLQELNTYLATGDEWKRSGWVDYLQLSDLQAEIDQPQEVRLSMLNRIRRKFESGVIGLQRPAFRRTRDALRTYYELARMAESDEARPRQGRERLNSALNRLERYLASGGERKERGWKRYLRWDALQRELATTEPDVGKLREIRGQFESGAAGLEKAPFRLAGRRLEKYIELLLLQRAADPVDLYATQMETLAQALEKQSAEPTAVAAADIARTTDWLDSLGQAPNLVQRIRTRYSRTNLFASVSERALREQVANVITDRSPVGQWFDGVYISGTALTNAKVDGQLVPNSDRVAFDILLDGTTSTSTVGRQRSVSIKSSGTTWLSGHKRVYFEPANGLSSPPASASASTKQCINGIGYDRQLARRLVTRIANRKANEKLPEAESLANRQARQRIAKQMDDEADKLIRKANQQLRDQIETPLRKQQLYPEDLHMWSTSTHVEVQARVTPDNHLGAPSDPPVWNRSHDMAVCLHESAVNNALAPFLGGLRIDNENIVELLESNDLEVPAELQPGGDAADEEWSVTFDVWQPVSVAIEQNRIKVSVLGVHFTRDGQSISERIQIGASYRVQWKAKQLPELFREGDVTVEFIDSPDQLSTTQIAYKTLLLRKVGSLFSEHIDVSELQKDEKVAELLEAITLRCVLMHDGWFAAGVDVDVKALPLEL